MCYKAVLLKTYSQHGIKKMKQSQPTLWKKTLISLSLSIGLISGCTAVADIFGADTATINAQSAQSYQQLVTSAHSKGALDTSSRTSQRIHSVFNRMVPYANQANTTGVQFNWQVSVFRTDEMNAFAMPGGKMAFYTGIVEKLNLSDDEIAAIMGHEMTHALHEHSRKAMGQKIITGVGLEIAGGVLAGRTGMDPQLVQQTGGILEEFGLTLPFSRSQEADADKGGLMLMAQAGYNPEAAVSVWEKMNKFSNNAGNDALSSITSTHPTNNTRIANIQKNLPSVMPVYQAAKNKKR